MLRRVSMVPTSYITALRFPLALLVVLIHTQNKVWQAAEAQDSLWFSVPVQFLSRSLPAVAVPLFFAISGFLFFYQKQTFTLADQREKLRKRSMTLLLPYVVWNLLAFLMTPLKTLFQGGDWKALLLNFSPLDVFCGSLSTETSVNLWGMTVWASSHPQLEPLWFVRDLMVIVLFAPLLHFLLRRVPVLFLIGLSAVGLFQLWVKPFGMTMAGWFYFSLGAVFSIHGLCPIETTRRLLRPALLVAALTLIWNTLPQNTVWKLPDLLPEGLSYHLYKLSAMVVLLHAARAYTRRRAPHPWLSKSSFFIYASHSIVLFPVTTLLWQLTLGEPPLVALAAYVVSTVIAVSICLVGYRVLQRWLPRPLNRALGI
ncbi:MAG: acyltransferase family protein [Alloprevotella sp.]